jgi:DNA-binding transcriptional MocR family regulator
MATDPPLLQYVARPGLLDLGWGHPHPSSLPLRAWSEASRDALSRYGYQALAYGHAQGPGPLLRWLTRRLSGAEGRICTPEQTFVTAGASHALDLVCRMITRTGDTVLVAAPTYHLALRIIADHGVVVRAAPVDGSGAIDVDRLRKVIDRSGRVAMLYTVPTFANPTGASLAPERRAMLVAMARETGLTIVEDDTYRELVYEGEAPPSLWSLARADEVVRIGSFAKTVAPGLRLGWINAGPPLIEGLTRLGYVDSGGGVNHTTALTLAVFGGSGAYDEHLALVRRRYANQRDALVTALRAELPMLDVPSPDGGWFVWLRLPAGRPASGLLPVAEADGVCFVPGDRFYPDHGGHDHIRLSFSMLGAHDLAEAAGRLAGAIVRSSGGAGRR